ncbi:MAG: ABC transporter permease [Methanomicrobiales archaeon]|nr:ABC transporter permease [Methanomicrobiales archaeon]
MALISRSTLKTAAKGLAVIIIMLVAWEIAAIAIDNNYILPTLGEIADVLLHPTEPLLGGQSLLANARVSLKEVLTGFLIAAALAIPLGLLIGWSSEIRAYLDPAIQMLRPIPPIAWMPFAIAWFGIGIDSILFIITLGAFFPLLINTVGGVQGVRIRWIEVAEMFHATNFEKLRTIILPGALPGIWTGLRISFAIAWMCVVAAEMLPGTTAGLGFLIMYAYNLGQLNVIGAGMVVIGIIGLGADILFQAGQQRFFGWQGRD